MKRYFFTLIYSCMMTIMLASGTVAHAQDTTSSCACNCVKPFFQYLIASHRLFTKETDHILISTLMNDANKAGYNVSYSGCPILSKNINKYFYAVTTDTVGTAYKARLGDCAIVLTATNNQSVVFSKLLSKDCDNSGNVLFTYNLPVHKIYKVNKSIVVTAVNTDTALFAEVDHSTYTADTTSSGIVAAIYDHGGFVFQGYQIRTLFSTDPFAIPAGGTVISAKLHLFAKPEGFNPPAYPNAHNTGAEKNYEALTFITTSSKQWSYTTSARDLLLMTPGGGTRYIVSPDGKFDNWVVDMTSDMQSTPGYYNYGFIMSNLIYMDSSVVYNTFCSPKYPDAGKQPYFDITYYPNPDSSVVAQLKVDTCFSCNTVPSSICYSAVTDTSVNIFTYGIAGNWRPYRSYAYYGDRSETDPSLATNIRRDGTIKEYSGFWKLVNGTWQPQRQDTGRWVWNSETTLFNRRGLELENKDPLGRFNAGLYGYDENLPVAVIQNAKYRESAFDGFEDYFFVGSTACDGACAIPRSFDFSSYKYNLDSTVQHTGKYSLRIAKDSSAGISASILPDTSNTFGLSFNTAANDCLPTGSVLKSIKAGKNALLPGFSPLAGKKIVISAWVKEAQACIGDTYTGNQIGIVVGRAAGNITVIAKPQGGIIEGWQRYEQVIDVPADATTLSINMQATGTSAVYFDDLRIHPYNANMKSFVYDPGNLRLMAELDENNYATMYEYDDDGTLIRLKKETERGIKTISETRSALLKEE